MRLAKDRRLTNPSQHIIIIFTPHHPNIWANSRPFARTQSKEKFSVKSFIYSPGLFVSVL